MISKIHALARRVLNIRFVKSFLNRETAAYAIVGLLTSLFNVGLFQLLYFIGLDYRLANLITLLTVKFVAYFLYKYFVFQSHCETKRELLKEIASYIAARSFSMLVEFSGLFFWSSILLFSPATGKWVVTGVVIVLNYVLGKTLVFIYGNRKKQF